MDNITWKTIDKNAEVELIEKRSRFIARAFCVTTEADALAYLTKIRTRHRDATHNVYAYVLRENNIARFSDDGEPSGTAGKPIIDILKKEELVDIIIIVTRYFGGTLLGTGGLVRAYSDAAKGALTEAGIITIRCLHSFRVTFPYEYFSAVQSRGYAQLDADYGEVITLTLCAENPDEFTNDINDATNGTAKIIKGELTCQKFCY